MAREGKLQNDQKQKHICTQTVIVIEGSLEVNNKKQREVTRGGPSCVGCDVCMDVISIRDSIRVPKCNHMFCRDCIESYLQNNIQKDVRQVKCPDSKCRVVLKSEFCRRFIPEKVYEGWTKALTEIYALENAREVQCPSEDCEGVFTIDRRGGAKKLCLKCQRQFCLRCKSELLYIGHNCNICERMKRHFNHHRSRGSKIIYHI